MELLKMIARSIRGRFVEGLIAIGTVAMLSMLLVGFQATLSKQYAELDRIYEETVVNCTVSNIKGTATDNLNIPSGYLDFFMPGGMLFDDVKDFRCSAQASFLVRPGDIALEERIYLYLINTPDAVSAFQRFPVSYLAGCSKDLYDGDEPVGIISSSLLPEVSEDGTMTLCLPPQCKDGVTFRVVGTCESEMPVLYLSVDAGKALYERNAREFTLSTMSFTVADNRRLNETKTALSNYFMPANRYNTANARLGLIMDDATLIEAVAVTERRIALLRLFQAVLCLLAGGICFLVCLLLIGRRRAELAVMRSLGCGRGSIWIQIMLEYALYFCLGMLPAILLGQGGTTGLLSLFALWWMLVVFVSVFSLTSGDIMRILKGKE